MSKEREVVYLLASITGAMPETVRLKRTAKREMPPVYIGKLRTASSLFETHSATQFFFGLGPVYSPSELTEAEALMKRGKLG